MRGKYREFYHPQVLFAVVSVMNLSEKVVFLGLDKVFQYLSMHKYILCMKTMMAYFTQRAQRNRKERKVIVALHLKSWRTLREIITSYLTQRT